jgi:hypothetical protein
VFGLQLRFTSRRPHPIRTLIDSFVSSFLNLHLSAFHRTNDSFLMLCFLLMGMRCIQRMKTCRLLRTAYPSWSIQLRWASSALLLHWYSIRSGTAIRLKNPIDTLAVEWSTRISFIFGPFSSSTFPRD